MAGSKVLVIHSGVSDSNGVRHFVANLRPGGSDNISVVSFADKARLGKEAIDFKTASQYVTPEEHEQILRDSIAFVTQLGREPIGGETNLIKLLEYEGTSLWWFVEPEFYYYHIRDIFYQLESLKRILEKENPQKIVMVKDNSHLAGLAATIAESRGISIQFVSPTWPLRAKAAARHLWAALSSRSLHLGRSLLRMVVMNWNRAWPMPPASKHDTHRKILICPSGDEQVIIDPKTGVRRKEDMVLGSIVSHLVKEGNQLVNLSNMATFLRNKLPKAGGQPIAFRHRAFYFTPRVYQKVLAQKGLLREKWAQLERDSAFKQAFTYHGVNLWDICRHQMEAILCTQAPSVIRAIELSKHLVEVEKLQAVVAANETNMYNRALIAACHRQGIPVVALQHGVLVTDDARFIKYRYARDELAGNPNKLSITPNRLCVSGDSIKKVLLQLGFPGDRIAIIGQPRYDKLARAAEFYDREKFCAQWGIDPTQKIVLIGSQPFRIRGIAFRYEELKCILLALKNEPQVQIVVKPHPYEKEAQHQELAREVSVRAAILPRSSDTNEALFACDVLVTFFSSIALEAMILGKPVVTVNLLGYPDPVPYAQAGSALGVYRAEDIGPTIKKALEDAETRHRLAQRQQKYLEEQFYKLDGQATERAVNIIYDMIDNKATSKSQPILKV